MSHKPLPNYLRAFRKSCGLSQDELAFLLECQSGKTVSRYERFGREPDLSKALACEVIFAAAARELFAGLYFEVEKATVKNVQFLLEKLTVARRDRATQRKIRMLEAVLEKKLDVLKTAA